MRTGENSIIEARILSHSTVTRVHSALICSSMQVHDVVGEYNN